VLVRQSLDHEALSSLMKVAQWHDHVLLSGHMLPRGLSRTLDLPTRREKSGAIQPPCDNPVRHPLFDRERPRSIRPRTERRYLRRAREIRKNRKLPAGTSAFFRYRPWHAPLALTEKQKSARNRRPY